MKHELDGTSRCKDHHCLYWEEDEKAYQCDVEGCGMKFTLKEVK